MVKIRLSHKQGFFLLSACAATLASLLTCGWLILPISPSLFGKTVRYISTKEKVVALTFDDGPNPPYTDLILAVLKKHEIKATFFVVGERAEKYPECIQAIYKEGHELGNHTWSHHILVGKSDKFIINEITKTDTILRDLGYTGTIHFRSPKGMKFVGLSKILSKQKRPLILFDTFGWDWTSPGVEKITHEIITKVHSGSIILLHDGNGDDNSVITDRSQTVEATDAIISTLKIKGYRFVTISELLDFKKKKCDCLNFSTTLTQTI